MFRLIRAVLSRPGLAGFLFCVALADIVLMFKRTGLTAVLESVLAILLCVLTWWFTRSDADTRERTPAGRMVGLQLLACVFVIVATSLDGAAFNHVLPAWASVPWWGSLHVAIAAAASRYMTDGLANGVGNFVMYCIPIVVILMLLRVPLGQLGFGRFRRGSLATSIAWLVLPVFALGALAVTGQVSVSRLLAALLSNLFNNGVSEEFLWRGAFMSRLRAVMSADWALILQAILFGLWHFGADLHVLKADMVHLGAVMIASQMMLGFAFGYVTLRTGNIAIATLFHCSLDAFFGLVE